MSLAAGLALLACRRDAAPRPAPAAAQAVPGAHARVRLESPSGRASTVVAEVARTPAEHERGLMFRERLADGEGMLFVFDEEGEHAFWMKNTLVPLDMIFVDSRGTVTGVVERAEPGSLAPRSAGRSRWVLEVPGGWAAAHGVRAGDRVTVTEP